MAYRRRRRKRKAKLIFYTLIVLLCSTLLWFVLNKNSLGDNEVIIENETLPDVDTQLEAGHQGDIRQSTKGEEDSIKPEIDSDNTDAIAENNSSDIVLPDSDLEDQDQDSELALVVEQELKVIKSGNYLLALVTKETTLKSDYVPNDLQTVPSYMNPAYSMQLRARPLEYLEKLWQAAADEGIQLAIRSAYRSYSTQQGLFQDYANRYGPEEANRFSARPGQSEHQLGATVDFGGTAHDFTAAYADTPQGLWLAENAWRFGFAMSYPAGLEHITGYIFEPWHYRYIGIDAAAEWKRSSKTLKEYLEMQEQFFE